MTVAELRFMRRRGSRRPDVLEQAKIDALEAWEHLAAHGEISDKAALPTRILHRIWQDSAECPLCALFFSSDCEGCPLEKLGTYTPPAFCACIHTGHPFVTWFESQEASKRAEAAAAIVKAIKAWKIPKARKAKKPEEKDA